MLSRLLNLLHHAGGKIKYPLYYFRHNKIGSGTFITSNVLLHNCAIGKQCYIGNNCILNGVELGNYCSIAPGVQIGGMEHAYWDLSTSPYLSNKHICNRTTKIGHDVWIAAGAIIKQGVTIGDGAVIGAHSLVTKDVPPYAVCFGVPVEVHKYRFTDEVIEKLNASRFWEYDKSQAQSILDELRVELEL